LIGYGRLLLALALSLLGRHSDAHSQADSGLQLCQDYGDLNQIAWSFWVLGWVLASMARYSEAEDALRSSIAHYRQIEEHASSPRQIGWALSLLAYVLWRQGQRQEARAAVRDVLALSVRLRDFLPRLKAFATAALMLAEDGQKTRAAELYALVWQYPLASKTRGWFEVVGQELAAVAGSLPPEDASAAAARGMALDFDDVTAALLDVLAASD